VVAAGYSVQESLERPECELSYGLRLSKTQPIDQEAMDKTTLELFRLSKQFHADYDGWESEVIDETRSKNPSSLIN
jgi:hypothetical protein